MFEHSTIAYNIARQFGDADYEVPFLPTDNDFNNTAGGGMFISPGSVVTLNHAIVANNTHEVAVSLGEGAFAHSPDIHSNTLTETEVLAGDWSIIGSTAGLTFPIVETDTGSNQNDLAVPLEPLQQRGGVQLPDNSHLFVIPIPCDSPARDAGKPSLVEGVTAPSFDERGDSSNPQYHRIFNGVIDIGAFELQDADFPTLAADFDMNGKVDAADLAIWKSHFDQRGVPGDADGDGEVDAADLDIWRAQFGHGVTDPVILQQMHDSSDFNNDGFIDGDDFVIWARNLGVSGMSLTKADGDANGDHVVDGLDFILWQRELGERSGCADWVHSVDLLQTFQQGKLVVSTLSDEDDGYYGLGALSLREAIDIAANNTGFSEISFADSLTGTIHLNGTELELTDDAVIHGPSADRITIDAGGQSRVFSVNSGVTAEISGLTITGGAGVTAGGGVMNSGDLTLDSVVVSGNSLIATGSNWTYGGGVYSNGTLTIQSSTIDGNQARIGGGTCVTLSGANTLLVDNSTISNNIGLNEVASGQPDGSGGGLFLNSLSGTTGGAVIVSSTFSGNRAKVGAGLSVTENTTSLSIYDSTIADNKTSYYVGATLTPITAGYAGGIQTFAASGAPSVSAYNTIIAANTAENANHQDVWGAFATGTAYNIIGQVGTSGLTNGVNHNQVGTSTTFIDPHLGPLADNGGPTKTHALLYNSTAIEAGSGLWAANAGAADADQRGYSRYGTVDIGAVERGIVVSTPDDESDANYAYGDLSLREAIALAAANGTSRQDVSFDPLAWADPIDLTSLGTLSITSDVDIHGPGADLLTVDGHSHGSVFIVSSGVTATISGIKITGGGSTSAGGGVNNHGSLTLSGVELSGNSATFGGGVSSDGSLLSIEDSLVSDNSAGWGGGISAGVSATGKVIILRSAVIGNTADDGSPSTTNGEGGGLRLLLQSGTPTDYNLQIVNSTFGQNTAENSGGGASINNGAKALILNSTFSENDAAAGHGGGLYIPNTVGGRTLVQNTLIAANTGSNASTADVYAWKASGSDMAPVLDASSTHNLIGVTSTTIGLPSTGNLSGTSTTPLDAKLLALENNGGWTPTYALGDGSPAVDAGSDDFANGYWFDQRLKPRLTDGNLDAIEMVDIGAYEADADEFFAHLGI